MAKTLLVRALAAALQLEFKRVQFTPDLMPGDVTGSLVYDAHTAEFEFHSGPVFTNLLLADEINRTPPKTQAALLEAMEERQVSVEGAPRPLPDPFIVAATQNPIEYEGTYQLPEAQLDRFLLKLNVPLPPRDQEIAVLDRHARGFDPRDLSAMQPVAGVAELAAGRDAVRQVLVADEVLGYIVDIVGATRHSPRCNWGCRRAVRLRCWPPPARGHGCPAAITLPRTTSRRWHARRCGTGLRCGRRPNSRAPTPTAYSTASWRLSRCHASGPHRPRRAGGADLRAADRVLTLARNGFHRPAGRARGGGGGGRGVGGQHPPAGLHPVRGYRRRLGQPVDAVLAVENTGRRRFRGQIRDAWPPSARAEPRTHAVNIAAGQRNGCGVETHLQPVRRGDQRSALVTARSVGPLGLAGRQSSHRVPWQIRILPPFLSRKHLPSRLAKLRELDGMIPVLIRGQGTEFDSLREYVVGDDVRSIDWRATARRADVVVRTWRPERDRRVVIVLDTGRTSAGRVGVDPTASDPGGWPRLDWSMDAALLLAALASRAGDHVDFLAYDRVTRPASQRVAHRAAGATRRSDGSAAAGAGGVRRRRDGRRGSAPHPAPRAGGAC